MRMFGQAPVIGKIPTLDGAPPPPDVQEQVVMNQVQASTLWNETEKDMILNNIVNEREDLQMVRWEIVALVVVVFALMVAGLVWTHNSIEHDRMIAYAASASEKTPYTPETIR